MLYFRSHPAFASIPGALRPGGVVCVETFHVLERERSGRPKSELRVLRAGRLEEAGADPSEVDADGATPPITVGRRR